MAFLYIPTTSALNIGLNRILLPICLPGYFISFMNLAGTPPTIVFRGTLFDTTAPAATIAFSPIVTPARIVELEPIQTFFSSTIGAGYIAFRSSGAIP